MKHLLMCFHCFLVLCPAVCVAQACHWEYDRSNSIRLHEAISVPEGYQRPEADTGSFAHWLRSLPVRTGEHSVRLYNGALKANQSAHWAVLDIDVGNRDLQQCADAVMRLRAEYLYSRAEYDSIRFCFTSGDTASYRQWMSGFRPVVNGSDVRWEKKAQPDSSYGSFRQYLNVIFTYAGSYSLSKELLRVDDIRQIRIGDVFIQGGFPGHAVMVLDVAVNRESGDVVFLVAQSYMPAQDMHVLRNPSDSRLSPWYSVGFGDTLVTPEWTFGRRDLKRF